MLQLIILKLIVIMNKVNLKRNFKMKFRNKTIYRLTKTNCKMKIIKNKIDNKFTILLICNIFSMLIQTNYSWNKKINKTIFWPLTKK